MLELSVLLWYSTCPDRAGFIAEAFPPLDLLSVRPASCPSASYKAGILEGTGSADQKAAPAGVVKPAELRHVLLGLMGC